MRWMRPALLFCATLTACHFSVRPVDGDGGGAPSDMSFGGDGGPLALKPSGPASAGDYQQPNLATVNASGNVTFDTDTGAVSGAISRPGGTGVVGGIGFRVAAQADGPSVGVFSVAGFTLAPSATMTVRGNNAFALVSAGDVLLAGSVNGACSMNTPGPGGYPGGMMGSKGYGPGAGGGGQTAALSASGGGGAGYGDTGGPGGLIPTQVTPNAGPIWGDLVSPTFTLVGGAGGGSGGNMGAHGGGGGGALQFAVNGALQVSGVIDVGGCGGQHGGNSQGGGGGGAGGAIVLEAARVTLTGTAVLAANGGGGGGGDDKSTAGADANASVVPALGGTAESATGGGGGNGGASNGMPGQRFTHGRDGLIPSTTAYGGGGGGGCGRIAVRALNPTSGGISDNSTAITPDAADRNSAGAALTVYGAVDFQ